MYAALLLILACSDDATQPLDLSAPSSMATSAGAPYKVSVTPSNASLAAGATVQLTAKVTDKRGRTVQGASVTWASSNAGAATVSSGGLVKGVQAGSSKVIASVGSLRDTSAVTVAAPPPPPPGSLAGECAAPSAAWLWCDDFDADRLASYFEVDNAGGRMTRVSGAGQGGSWALKATYAAGTSNAGNLKLAFGATPDPGYVRPVIGGSVKYRDIYWRAFVRTQAGWSGDGAGKFSRAMVLAGGSWQQAAIGHLWSPNGGSGSPFLQLDPARGTDAAGTLKTTGYNDFANLTWLGAAPGSATPFSAANADRWTCVEAHMRLNDAGLNDGVFELWVGSALQASRANLNWLGAYAAYGINAIFFENYWDNGAPTAESRYLDNIVVSTERIGCAPSAGGGANPVAVVDVAGPATVAAGATVQMSAAQKDKTGAALSGTLLWQTSNTAVATVSAAGVVTGVAAGTATILAESANGKRGAAIVTVSGAAPPAPVNVTTTSLPGGTVGTSYSRTLQATGGSGAYAWSVAAGALPAGLSLDASTGAIGGTPVAAGTSTFTVQAASAGLSDTQALSLTIGASGAGAPAPNLVEDFSTYTSTANLLADPRNIYSEAEDITPGRIVLDQTAGYGSSTKSMRYDYPDLTGQAGRCGGYTIGRNVSFAAPQTEVWIETYVKFSANWAVAPWVQSDCGASYNPDFKMIFGRMTADSRFDFRFGNSYNDLIVAGYPGNEAAYPVSGTSARNYWDNRWHRFRYHWKFSTAGAGVVQVWVDDQMLVNRSGLSMSGAGNQIYGLALGRNLDPGAGAPQSMWWGALRVWYGAINPGW